MQEVVLPILYSFRRCPYAMRARLAIAYSGIDVEIREILLRDKPKEMLIASEKGTVPVLVLPDGNVIDESLDIMYWALKMNDSNNWLPEEKNKEETKDLIKENDGQFKCQLDKYKYSNRHPESDMESYRKNSEQFIEKINSILSKNKYLMGPHITIADMAIFPFIRQFAHVDKEWFYKSSYTNLQKWLDGLITSNIFEIIMKKYEQWETGDNQRIFPG
jgi:glutathione S-transferase